MAEIIITLTDTQVKCLEYSAYSVQDWCDNAVQNRAKIAQDEIIAKLLAHCNAKGIAIETGTDKQVAQAFTRTHPQSRIWFVGVGGNWAEGFIPSRTHFRVHGETFTGQDAVAAMADSAG